MISLNRLAGNLFVEALEALMNLMKCWEIEGGVSQLSRFIFSSLATMKSDVLKDQRVNHCTRIETISLNEVIKRATILLWYVLRICKLINAYRREKGMPVINFIEEATAYDRKQNETFSDK